MTNTTLWLVYDHQEHKWLKEHNHPTNYVDEASRFTREEAEKLVADVADKPWTDGKPPRVMVPDVRDEHEDKGLKGQANAVWRLVEAATEQMIADRANANTGPLAAEPEPIRTAASSLAERALGAYNDAYEAEQDEAKNRQAETDAGEFLKIVQALDTLAITPIDGTFRNYPGGKLCVPLTEARADEDRYWPAVAVSVRHGEVWVFAEDMDNPKPTALLPVAPLTGLDVVGKALAEGGSGRHDYMPPTVADVVRRELNGIGGDFSADGEVMLAVGSAICTALLDIADAIRERR